MFSPSVLPLAVSAVGVDQVAEVASAARAGRRRRRSPPSDTRPTGGCCASSGVRRPSASKSSSPRSTPARRAIAIRWMIAFVEPPIASTVVIALRNAARVQDVGRLEVLPHHVDDAPAGRAAIAAWRESAAGIEAAPGSVTPSASTALVIVDAVPIVMQCPGERAIPCSISCQSCSVMFAGAQFRPVLPDVRSRPQRRAAPVAAQHRTGRHEHRGQVHRRGAHDQARRRLVAAAHQHRAVDRVRPQQLLGLHRQEIAVQHRRRLLERLGQRHRRHLDREPAGRPHAALHLLHPLLEMRVARVDVAPGVDDRRSPACPGSRRRRNPSAPSAIGDRTSACPPARTSGDFSVPRLLAGHVAPHFNCR